MTDEMDQWLRPLIVLRVVVPGGEERAAAGGGRLVLTSVELWSDGVRWNVGQLPKPENPIRAPEWTMEDDIGTQYEVAGGGALGDYLGLLTWRPTFQPEVPSGAGELRLSGGWLSTGADFRVRVPG